VKKAGVKRIRIHDCRHSYATLAGRLGVPIKVISKSLGHADVATTLRIYTHALPAQRVELAEMIGAALFGGSAEVT
jgi:integrase